MELSVPAAVADHRPAVNDAMSSLVALFPASEQTMARRALLGPVWDNSIAELAECPEDDKWRRLAEAALSIFQAIQYPT